MPSIAKVSKNDLEVFLWQKSSFRIHKSFGKFFSIMALADVNDEELSLYGHFSRKNAPVHALTIERARPSTSFIQLHCMGLARKECL